MKTHGLLLMCLVLVAGKPIRGAEKLSPQLSALVNQVELAWHRQNPGLAWKLLQGPVRSFGPSQLERLDEALEDRELPSSAQILSDARLSIVQQNLSIRLPEPTIRERLLLIEGQQERTATLLEETSESLTELAEMEPPKTFQQFEDRFWEYHIVRNKLLSAERFRRYAASLARRVKSKTLNRLEGSAQETIRELQKAPLADVRTVQSGLAEMDRELRRQRLDFSVTALSKKDLDRDKFSAAFAIRLDLDVLSKLDLGQIKAAGTRRDIAASQSQAKTALDANKKLVDTATDFFVGLHWWQRGRYGIGTEVHGLAKSASALDTANGLVWLNMPQKPQPPEAATAGQIEVPQGPYHRRHHLIWAWEDRDVQFQKSTSHGDAVTIGKEKHYLSTFY